jgi:hypothetical protein
LALVHEFLNTRARGKNVRDLLNDAETINEWAIGAVRAWRASSAWQGIDAEPPALTERDAAKLRDLRNAIEAMIAGTPRNDAPSLRGAAALKVGGNGEICWTPTGPGWRWFYGAILGEVLLSHNAGTWPRLKQCRNITCRATFFDNSWNNTAVWHNSRPCGRP